MENTIERAEDRAKHRQLQLASIGFPPRENLDAAHDLTSITTYVQQLEQAGFAAMIVEDATIKCNQNPQTTNIVQENLYEPLTLLSALSTITQRIGLVATASIHMNEPFHLARRLASLDHFSGGRAGWNVMTNAVSHQVGGLLRSINANENPEELATEFLDIVRGLWDSYADDAIVADKQSGIYFRPGSRRPLHHTGKYFNVSGPLNVSRPPQGHPVIFYTVYDADDIPFAAQHADIVLINTGAISEVSMFRDQLNSALDHAGRRQENVQVWPVIIPFVASTEDDAKSLRDNFSDLNGGELSVAGTPGQVADELSAWFQSGLADGFVVRFARGDQEDNPFLQEVIPLLNQRNLFSPAKGDTLREVIGLLRPERSIR